jgi:uroporphyrinogen-III decarboxylase
MIFVPVVYEHAAALIHRRPFEVAFDRELLVAAHTEAFRRYHHAPVVVGIDVYNVEAEAYGARLHDTGGIAVPSIASPLCSGLEDIRGLKALDPSVDGRFPMILSAATSLRAGCKGAEVVVPLSGPFSILQSLLGMEELLFAAMSDPDDAREALLVVARHLASLIEAIVAQGFDVIVFESSASPPLLSPALFRKVEVPALSHIGQAYRTATGKGVAMILGGNTLPVIEDIVEAGAGSIICPAEVDRAAFMRVMDSHPGVAVRINMRPGVFTTTPEEASAEAASAVAIADGRSNVCIGSGVLPYDANPEIVLHVQSTIDGR